MVDTRIAARRAKVRGDQRLRRLRRTMLVLVVVVLAIVAVLVERSDLVALAEVRVTGVNRLEPAEVRSAADLALGTSTLRLRLDAARERVEALPLVAEAQVRRVDPLTVEIEVTEREPIAVVAGPGGPVLIDDEGVVLQRGSEDGLVLITLAVAVPEPGSTVGDVPALANAHAVLLALPGPLRSLVAEYEATAPDGLTLHLVDGTGVRFGRAERIDEKARALGAILEDLGDTTVTSIDVRAPSRPVVVP